MSRLTLNRLTRLLRHLWLDADDAQRALGPTGLARLEAQVGAIPEVLECLLITGQDADYQLKVVVADMDAYQELLLERITRIPGVTGVHSSFVLRRVIDKTALPLPGA